jgi:hypothetical protein
MTIHPNPNNGNFILELTYLTNTIKVQIFTLPGKLVFETKITALQTHLNTGLAPGNYTLKILENSSVLSIQKLVIR